eukprot:g3782.t1
MIKFFFLLTISCSSASVVTIDHNQFDSLIGEDQWLIKFYAPWCGHCQRLVPVFKEVAEELEGAVKVGKVDATQERTLTARFPVKGYPTIFFIDSQTVYKYTGSRSKEAIVHFARTGYKRESALPFFENPFSPLGKLKGAVIRLAITMKELYKMIVDKGVPSYAAFGILGAMSIFGVIILASFASWLFSPSEEQQRHAHQQ